MKEKAIVILFCSLMLLVSLVVGQSGTVAAAEKILKVVGMSVPRLPFPAGDAAPSPSSAGDKTW